MPCILPVSDLRNYNEVLQNVSEESPVFLTKNGRGCYVVIGNDKVWLCREMPKDCLSIFTPRTSPCNTAG